MHAEAALFDTLTNSSLSVNLLVRNLVKYILSYMTNDKSEFVGETDDKSA